MATHSSILVWEIPWTEEPGGLQSMGPQRVRHDLMTKQQCFKSAQCLLDTIIYIIYWLEIHVQGRCCLYPYCGDEEIKV